jgi:hypothetical protein
MEDNVNGGQCQWRAMSMKDNANGGQGQWRSLEVKVSRGQGLTCVGSLYML